MKLAVTLGVLQMLFGVTLGLVNDLFWHDYLSLAFEFVPRFLFMFCTFGYMVIIILYKFAVDWNQRPDQTPPNLVQTMISMFLSPGIVKSEDQLYDGQATLQVFFLLVALLCVPIMLFPQPVITKWRVEKAQRLGYNAVKPEADPEEEDSQVGVGGDAEDGEGVGVGEGKGFEAKGAVHGKKAKAKEPAGHGGGHGHGGPGEYSFGDHMITQGIHTIEFVLGAVSNTASYLRLWALSLAHSQLASVFWDKMIMQYGIDTGNPIMIFVGFAVWLVATAGVLSGMDSLECFLHALRLHWVEFQNKFYHADGYAFKPFSFEAMDKDADE